jgi:Zn-dependent protease with chaperone function
MSFELLSAVVTLAAFAVAHAAARIAMLPVKPGPQAAASARADVLLLRAAAPTAAALGIAFGVVLPAFVVFEPRHDGERVGVLMVVLGVLGAVHLLRVAWRGMRMLLASRAVVRAWRRGARELAARDWNVRALAIDAGFPVVAVSGLMRPTLFVDRRVLEACGASELAAIAAHECSHVRRRDNLRRLVLGACAGPRSAAAAAWRDAAEEAADDQAGASPLRRVDLASALLKVARLAPAHSLEATVLSTIHDGSALERRIRRLLCSEPPGTAVPILPLVGAACAAAAVLAGAHATAVLSSVHAVAEHAVRYLR